MKKKLLKALGYAGATAGLFMLAMEPAFAGYGSAAGDGAGLGNLTQNLRSSANSIVDILSLVSYVVGVGFGIKAALKFKEHNESKGQTPISQPIVLLVVAAFLLALPTLLIMAKDAVLGTGSSSTSISDATQLRQLN
jgi:hypothetical protein